MVENPFLPGRFELLSATGLIGQSTKGNWSFQVAGRAITKTIRLTPEVLSANLEFQFTGSVSTVTDANGEYTFEYLDVGGHTITVPVFILFGAPPSVSINLSGNQAGVNFAAAPVGVASLTPKRAYVQVHEQLRYQLVYTITNTRNWRELSTVQVIFRDGGDTALALEIDPAQHTFNEIRADGSRGPAFEPGRPNELETNTAVVYLNDSNLVTGAPDSSSFTADISVSFKPKADKRIFAIELVAGEQVGNNQGPYQVGVLQVGDIPAPELPPVDPEEDEEE
jgi:hypothetical protein